MSSAIQAGPICDTSSAIQAGTICHTCFAVHWRAAAPPQRPHELEAAHSLCQPSVHEQDDGYDGEVRHSRQEDCKGMGMTQVMAQVS